jgi:Leucine-rich repeat (LRR) protein
MDAPDRIPNGCSGTGRSFGACLYDNQLTDIPSEISHLRHLRSLNLAQNQLVTIPASVGGLEQLEMLDLGHNRLSVLPASSVG